jgi:hypothetical protein
VNTGGVSLRPPALSRLASKKEKKGRARSHIVGQKILPTRFQVCETGANLPVCFPKKYRRWKALRIYLFLRYSR